MVACSGVTNDFESVRIACGLFAPPSELQAGITPIVAVVGALTGIVGTFLGILNLVLAWRRHRVRLRVKPTFLFAYPPGRPGATLNVDPDCFYKSAQGKTIPKIWGVEVTNMGAAVKLASVGFLMKGTLNQAVISVQYASVEKTLPYLLEPHDSVTIFGDKMSAEALKDAVGFKCAFARIASGRFFTGSSRSLKSVIRALKKDNLSRTRRGSVKPRGRPPDCSAR